jgi:peptidoglycan/xylan/chitin deacetylase (PgdA/CDA1 family)
MTEAAYIPASGLRGKVQRLSARVFARAPLSIRLDAPLVTFTFDDFPKSAATTGAAMLEAKGWAGTYFAAGGFCGQETHHGAMFDQDDLKRLIANGHEIACHTYSHLDAASGPKDAFVADVDRNAAFLDQAGLRNVETFAFPYGEATPGLKQALSDRFAALRGVRPGVNRGASDRSLLKAVPLDGGLAGLQRALDAARDAARRPGWLIYYGHDVQDAPTTWGCTPEFLGAVINAVAAMKAEVLPMAEALKRIEAGRS